jgi:hypothetical protein
MFDANEIDFAPIALDCEDTAREHGDRCGCRHCDPDFYFDPAELDAGTRDLRW